MSVIQRSGGGGGHICASRLECRPELLTVRSSNREGNFLFSTSSVTEAVGCGHVKR